MYTLHPPCPSQKAVCRDVWSAAPSTGQARSACRRPTQAAASVTASVLGDEPLALPPPLPTLPRPLPFPTRPQQQAEQPQSEPLQPRHSVESRTRPKYDLTDAWQPTFIDPSRLTTGISQCSSCADLFDILATHQGRLNAVHVATAFHRAAALTRRPRGVRAQETRILHSQLLPLLLQELDSVKATMQPRAIASTLHALGVLDIRERDVFAELAAQAEGRMADFTPQGLGNMLWAFARTGLQPSARWMAIFVGVCHAKLAAFSAQDLSMVVWSFSKLKYRLGDNKKQDFITALERLLPRANAQAMSMALYAMVYQGAHPGEAWLDTFCSRMLAQPGGLAAFPPQALTTILWSLSRLRHPLPPALCQALTTHLVDSRLHGHQPIDVATLLYALGHMRAVVSEPLYRVMYKKLNSVMYAMQPSQLANAGLALVSVKVGSQTEVGSVAAVTGAGLGTAPGTAHAAHGEASAHTTPMQQPATAAATAHHPHAHTHTHQKTHHPKLSTRFLSQYISVTYAKLPAFNSRDLSMLTQALARMRCQLPDSYLSALQRRIEQLGATFQPTDISLTLWALQRLGAAPTASLMVEFFVATDKRLSSFRPQELSLMIWSLAQAQYKPDKAWLDEFLHCTFPRMSQFTAQGLSNIALALAQLDVRPPPAWLYALVKTATPLLPTCNIQDLQGMIQGLARINDPPNGLQLQKVTDFVTEAREMLAARLPGAPAGVTSALQSLDGLYSDAYTSDLGLSAAWGHSLYSSGSAGPGTGMSGHTNGHESAYGVSVTRGGSDSQPHEEEILQIHEQLNRLLAQHSGVEGEGGQGSESESVPAVLALEAEQGSAIVEGKGAGGVGTQAAAAVQRRDPPRRKRQGRDGRRRPAAAGTPLAAAHIASATIPSAPTTTASSTAAAPQGHITPDHITLAHTDNQSLSVSVPVSMSVPNTGVGVGASEAQQQGEQAKAASRRRKAAAVNRVKAAEAGLSAARQALLVAATTVQQQQPQPEAGKGSSA